MRAAYARRGVAVPDFARCETLEQALAFARARELPAGRQAVARLGAARRRPRRRRGASWRAAFEEARAHSASAGLPLVVVESWLEGREYSVNGWIEDGRLVSYCVTERLTVPGRRPLGVMLAEVYPSGLSAEDEARVVEEARRGAAALGHVRGPCYSQVALGPSRVLPLRDGGAPGRRLRRGRHAPRERRRPLRPRARRGRRRRGARAAGDRRRPRTAARSRSSSSAARAPCAPSTGVDDGARRRRASTTSRCSSRSEGTSCRSPTARSGRPTSLVARGHARRGHGARRRGARAASTSTRRRI